MKDEKLKEILEALKKPTIKFIKDLLEQAGEKVTDEQAENILTNLGDYITLSRKDKPANLIN